MAYVFMIVCAVVALIGVVVAVTGFFLFAKGVFNGPIGSNEKNNMFKYFIMFGGGNFVFIVSTWATIGCAIWAGIANYQEIVNYFNQ